MGKKFALLAILSLLAACGGPAEEQKTTSLGYQVDKLFTVDGCTVYRFVDDGRYRYFSKCAHAESTTSWTERHGKIFLPQDISTEDL